MKKNDVTENLKDALAYENNTLRTQIEKQSAFKNQSYTSAKGHDFPKKQQHVSNQGGSLRAGYQAQYDALKLENDRLSATNKTLSAQNRTIQYQMDELQKVNQGLIQEKDKLILEKTDVTLEFQKLELKRRTHVSMEQKEINTPKSKLEDEVAKMNTFKRKLADLMDEV